MRVAAIDVGTNSVLLLVAEASPGGPRAVAEDATITRLGEAVDETRTISPAATERTLRCLERYAARAQQEGVAHVAAVGTSVLRDALGSDRFVREAEHILGVPLRVIGGDAEAALTFEGAMTGLQLEGDVTVFDVGGGSTEIIFGRCRSGCDPASRSASFATSLDIGSVRLTERYLRGDPPDAASVEEARKAARSELDGLPLPRPGAALVGVAGTITTLSAIQLELATYDPSRVHGSRLSKQNVCDLTSRLAALTLARRKALTGLEPKRADVIVAGAVIAGEVLRWSKAAEIVVSDRGVRWGLALRLLDERGV